jgi:outer membrane protein TolC
MAVAMFSTAQADTTPTDKTAPNAAGSLSGLSLLKAKLSKTQELALSLEQALRMAQENNPDYKTSLSVVKQFRAAYLTQLASLLPDVGVSMPYIKFNGAFPLSAGLSASNAGSGGPGANPSGGSIPLAAKFHLYEPQFTLSYQIFQGGTRIFQILAARKNLTAQKEQSHLTLEQTLQRTAQAYYTLQRQLDQIAIAQKQVDESQEQLAMNKTRLEVGVGTRLDVLQSEAQLAQARQALLSAYQQTESAAAELNELLNLPALVAVVPDKPTQEMRTLVPLGDDFKSLLDTAHRNHPDIKRIQAQIAALGQTRNTVFSGYLPQLNLQYANGAIGAKLNQTQHFDQTSLTVGLNYKNAGITGVTQFMQDTAQIEEQRNRLQAQLNAIDKNLTDAYLQAFTAAAQIDTAKVQIAASEQALADAIERLQAGVGRNIDVTDAETKLIQARTNLSQAMADYNLAQVNLVFNLGLASVDTLTQGIPHP